MRDLARVAAALVASAAVLTGCSTSQAGGPVANVTVHDADGMNGAVPVTPYPVKNVALTSTDGSTYRLASDSRKPLTLVFFGYTHCPDICQIVMADIASAVNRLDPADRAKVGVVFVTTDPARDDTATLRAYLDRFNPAFEGLTGPLPAIVAAGRSVGVEVAKGQKLPSGGYEVAHGTQIIGMTPGGKAPIVWTEGTPAPKIAEDIHVILANGGVPTPGGSP